MRFAAYLRTSTEDQQDPQSSRAWQLARATQLIEPHGGEVVREFFDVGQSRALPWRRRPEASALLDVLPDQARGFDAVVIGEPARAFSGAEFALVFPVFTHWGVELWVPEVGGRVDPGSEAHDLVMLLFGGMSKGERNRIKIRVRTAMSTQARTEGRFLGGRPPYGYGLSDAGPHPNTSKAASGVRLHKLARDPVAARIVERIFDEYVKGAGLYAIAEGLTRDGIPSPSGYDPERNRHRQSSRGAWSKSAVRAILRNPRYTGRQVWNRQGRHEELVDVDNVALGHNSRMRWNDPADWIWSAENMHEEIVSPELFASAQAHMLAGRNRPLAGKRGATRETYLLRGFIRCDVCSRTMGSQRNGSRHLYRCRYPEQYAIRKGIEHPLSVSVGEAVIVERLDDWLLRCFDPANIDETLDALDAAQRHDPPQDARVEGARRTLASCDAQLAKYRAALEAGADPKVVTTWIAEVQGKRMAAEQVVADSREHRKFTRKELRELVLQTDIREALQTAERDEKRKLYESLGLSLTFDPVRRVVRAEARGWVTVRVGGGI